MNEFQDKLKIKMDEYVKLVYKVSRSFPREEVYGITSQLRRASLSIILNYIEGFARFKKNVKHNFYEIAYGSLKESKYLVYFCHSENFIDKETYNRLLDLSEEIGKMLWTEMK